MKNSKENKISYWWILLWIVSNIALGFACFYIGYFAMVLAAVITFPILQALLLSLKFESIRSYYWLLLYFSIFLSGIFMSLGFIGLIATLIFNLIVGEVLLGLISKKFGRFVFTAISLLGVGVIYKFMEIRFTFHISGEVKLLIVLFVSSFFTGLGIEVHRWNTADI